MKVELVNARDVFKDDNNGFIFGLQEVDEDAVGYTEWFRTELERDKVVKDNMLEVIN